MCQNANPPTIHPLPKSAVTRKIGCLFQFSCIAEQDAQPSKRTLVHSSVWWRWVRFTQAPTYEGWTLRIGIRAFRGEKTPVPSYDLCVLFWTSQVPKLLGDLIYAIFHTQDTSGYLYFRLVWGLTVVGIWVKHQEGLQTPDLEWHVSKHAALEGTLSRHPHRRSSVNYERTMKKTKKSFVLRRFQISKLTKLCCVFARYIWCGHSQTHPRHLRSQVKKGLGARLTSAIHWNSKKVMDMIQLLRALPGELFGKHMGFCMGFFAWSQPPARPETSPMRRLQMASNHHPQRLCVRQKSLDLAGECTLMFPLKVQRIFTSAGTCCFFQKQIWAVTNKTTYIYIYYIMLHIDLIEVGLISAQGSLFVLINMGPLHGKVPPSRR